MYQIKYDKRNGNYYIVIKEGDYIQDVFRTIIKASYALDFPYYGLGFLHRNPAAQISDEEADEYIHLNNPYLTVNMEKYDTYVLKTGVPFIFYVDIVSFEKNRYPISYLFSEMEKHIKRK